MLYPMEKTIMLYCNKPYIWLTPIIFMQLTKRLFSFRGVFLLFQNIMKINVDIISQHDII